MRSLNVLILSVLAAQSIVFGSANAASAPDDVLELARQRRPHYFNLDVPKPMPPTPRDCSLEVSGRLAADGSRRRDTDP